MSTNQDAWQTYYTRFDPEEVAEKEDWRVDRPKSPMGRILTDLKRPVGEAKFLLIGNVGSGKSTELRRIMDAQGQRRITLFLDLYRHFDKVLGDANALTRIQPWEVLFLIGLAVWRVGKEYGFLEQEHATQLEKALKALREEDEANTPTMDIIGLAKALTITLAGIVPGLAPTLNVFESIVGAAQWSVKLGKQKSKYIEDQDTRAQSLLHAVRAMIAAIQQKGAPLVLVVDGLDRMTDRIAIERCFLNSELLGALNCRMVMTGPLLLAREGLISRVRHFKLQVLAEVPVLDQANPWQPSEYITFFRNVVAQRSKDLRTTIPPNLIDKIGFYSGGRMRQFIKMVREIALLCWDVDALEANEDMVHTVIDDARRDLERGIRTSHIQILSEIAIDPHHALPDPERRSDGSDPLDELLLSNRLLAYPNESEWFFPHPLLTLRKVPQPGVA